MNTNTCGDCRHLKRRPRAHGEDILCGAKPRRDNMIEWLTVLPHVNPAADARGCHLFKAHDEAFLFPIGGQA